MPLKLNVGLSRKVGMPNFGSLGASCSLESELDPLLLHDTETLQQRVEQAFDVCRVAVDNELIRHHPSNAPPESPIASEPLTEPVETCLAVAVDSTSPLATSRQIDFAHHLARQIRALGGQRLNLLAQQFFSRPLEELTTLEASRLIDLLKELRAGTRSVDDLLAGAAA